MLFGISLSDTPKWAVLLIGVVGVFVSFLVQGTAQEALYTRTKFQESIFFTFVQFLGYFSLTTPFFVQIVRGKQRLHASVKLYFIVSISLVCSMGLSNLSVERLSYPTAVLFKSSKLIPVMVGGFVFLKKRYNWIEVLAVLLVVAGLVGISYSDKISKNKFDMVGVVLSVISLCFDAIASNLQEKALSVHNAPQAEVISMMYFIGIVILFVVSVISGQFATGVEKAIEEPRIIAYLAAFGFLGAIGVQFVYLLMKAFGSLVTVMVTSTRKAFTVCLSFLIFKTKRFSVYHALSILAIGCGLVLSYVGKNQKKREVISDNGTKSGAAPEHLEDSERLPLVEYRQKEPQTD